MTMESVNERDLLSAASQGSQIAYRELIRLHQDAVYCFAWALIGEEHAQRVTEDAFLTTWRQLEHFKTFNLSFRDRLLQLVCLDCAELSKRIRRHRGSFSAEKDEAALNDPLPLRRYDPRTNMEHLALQTDMEEALRALPFRLRQIYLLHEMADLADTQIADILGDSAQNVHTDLGRARGFVRRQILLGGGFFPLSDAESEKGTEKYQACRTYLPTLAAAAEDLCTAAEKQALSAHFATCPGCQAYYDALRAMHHSIAVMRHDAPVDLAPYIISRIQQELGRTPQNTPTEEKKHRHFRPAFGRFTIIALCIALVLLAYSGRMGEQSDSGRPQQNAQSQQQSQSPEVPAQNEEPSPNGEEEPLPPEDAEPELPEEGDTPAAEENGSGDDGDDADDPGTDEGGSTGTLVPGGGASSTLIPEGETYAAVYRIGAEGADILAQYCTLSFRATLTDGTNVLYYVLPAASDDEVSAALADADISYEAYTAPEAIDPAAPTALYLLLS